jgi:hypothetical protein
MNKDDVIKLADLYEKLEHLQSKKDKLEFETSLKRKDIKMKLAILISILFGFVLWGAHKADEISCKSKWEQSGMNVKYGFYTGCIIEVKPNVWIPAVYYREI